MPLTRIEFLERRVAELESQVMDLLQFCIDTRDKLEKRGRYAKQPPRKSDGAMKRG